MEFEQFANNSVDLVLSNRRSPSEDVHGNNILSLKLSELDIDSLYFMEIVIDIEDMIDIQATDEDLSGDPTFEDFLRRIYAHKV